MHVIYDRNSGTSWLSFYYNEEEYKSTIESIKLRLRWRYGADYVPDLTVSH